MFSIHFFKFKWSVLMRQPDVLFLPVINQPFFHISMASDIPRILQQRPKSGNIQRPPRQTYRLQCKPPPTTLFFCAFQPHPNSARFQLLSTFLIPPPLKTTKKPVLELPRRRALRAQVSTIKISPSSAARLPSLWPVALRPRVAPGLPLSERCPIHVLNRLAKTKNRSQEKNTKSCQAG